MAQPHNSYDRATRTTISECEVRRQNRHRSQISVCRIWDKSSNPTPLTQWRIWKEFFLERDQDKI